MTPSVSNYSASYAAASAANSGKSGYTSVYVDTDKVQVKDDAIYSSYTYENAQVEKTDDGKYKVKPTKTDYQFKVDSKVPKTGIMLVGLGGNNGSTFCAAIEANRHNISFRTKTGEVQPNYYGSVTQAATIKLGIDADGKEVYAPFNEVVPFLHPNDFVIGGWDINNANVKQAMEDAQVLDYDLQRQLGKYLEPMVPMPSVYYPGFIASNQNSRANNVIEGTDKWAHVEQVQSDIRSFKERNELDEVIVLWTANTERYADLIDGVNDTSENLLNAIKQSHKEIAPSTIFAVACILEGIPFINGSPQNTFVPGCVKLAEERNTFIGGDDFKSGQTKVKSVMAQYLVDAGIRPVSVASYNHLGNRDGHSLSEQAQFRSKEISKSSVIDDMIESNHLLYNEEKGKDVDHCIVIKYMPHVGDSKVAMDEYHSELMLGGHNTISLHNVCEDSLLATPLMIDLVVVAEFLSRVSYKKVDDQEYQGLHSVMSFLSYWLKAPLTRPGADPVNGLNKQRAGLENFMRALVGLAPSNDLKLEERLW